MKKLFILLGFLSVLSLAAENLIVNGNFAQGAKFWTFASWTKTTGKREIKKEGDMYYLSLTCADDKFDTSCVQMIKLKPDTTYMFKFRMRTKDVKRQDAKRITHGAGIALPFHRCAG